MAKSNTNKRYALRKLGKIFGSVIVGLTLFLGGILNTSFVHADGTGVTFIKDDTRRKGEEPETDVDEVGNIIVKVPAKDSVETKVIPIETEYLDDPTLDKGQQVEEIPGKAGEVTIITTYTVDEEDGTVTEHTSRQTRKEMEKRRIRRGTREPEKVVVPAQPSTPSYFASVTSNQGTDATVEPAKPVAPTTGWKQENGMWYFYNTDGSLATGQVQNNGSWYYLNSNGSMKANQWFQVGGKWYYVNASGELAVNTSIDGYRVNDNGEWVR